MRLVILSGLALAIALLAFSSYIFLTAPRNVKAQVSQPIIKSIIDPGFAIGPIALVFEPIINIPETIKGDEAFPVSINMNLVDSSPIGLSEVPLFLPELGNALQLRLLLGGAEFQPEDWQSAGADLFFEWSVKLAGGGKHIGSIEKRIVADGIAVDRTSDQIRIELKVNNAFAAWNDAWGLATGIVGFLLALGSFYFSWREHLRKEQAHQT